MKKLLLLVFTLASSLLSAHTEELQVIEVGHGKDASSLVDFIPSASVLREKEILRRREISLGETINHEPGVQSTSFGPNASRPVIRGLEGDRIRVLQNGLGTLDASSQSVDHALPIDTMTVDKIEIVRGPMSLLYGSSAVGGVVNVINSRIHREYSPGLINQLDVKGETVNNGMAGAGRMDFGKDQWMYHLEGSYHNLGPTEIPGEAYSDKYQQLNPGEEVPEDRLTNSENQQSSFALGASKIFGKGFAGLSYYRFDNEYGTIISPDVDIRMQQNRIEAAGEYRIGTSNLKRISFRSAQSFYKHEELEEESVGTTFRNEGNESRLELHSETNGWRGVSGLQTQISTFRAAGAEAFLPTSKNRSLSLFSLQEHAMGKKSTIQLGGRLEGASIEREGSERFGEEKDRNFLSLNGSVGLLHKFSPLYSSSASLSYTERTPNFQELYADGEHVATGTFEIGDTSLEKEKSLSLEATIKKAQPDSKLALSAFYQKFENYILLSPTGTFTAEGLPELSYEQEAAFLYGGEIESQEELIHSFAGGSWWLNTTADFVIGWNESTDDYLPRMPAPRLLIGIEYYRDLWTADIELAHYFEQQRTAPNEIRTEAFSLLNLGVIRDIPSDERNYRIYFRAKNLLNQEARLHTSFVKDRVPLPGRNFIAGVQALF